MISLDSSEEEAEPTKRPKAKKAAVAPKQPAAATSEEPEGKYLISQLEQYKLLYEYAIAKLKEQK